MFMREETMTRVNSSAVPVLIAVACLLVSSTAFADVPIEGDVILHFTSLYDKDGNLSGYRYEGAQANLELNAGVPLVVPIGLKESKLGEPSLFWSEVPNWNNPILGLVNMGVVVKAVVNDLAGLPSLKENYEMINTLLNGGPTERSVSVPGLKIEVLDIEDLELEFGVDLDVKYDVYLDSGADIVMDQTVILERLRVLPGARVVGNNTFVTRTDLINHGRFDNLMGIIEGDFENTGILSQGGGAWITGLLDVRGNLSNAGDIRVMSGSLNLSHVTANHGLIVLDGGSLYHAETFGNYGTFEWRAGSISGIGDIINHGFTTFSGDSSKIMTQTAHLKNAGTVTDSSTGLNFWSGSQISNLSGGLYDLQADGQYFGHMSDGGQIYNEGTFRKSAGEGESVIGPRVGFHNAGTLEVLSGTLGFGGGGSSEDAEIHLENGGRVRFSDDFRGYTANSSNVDLYGETAITGNGTVEVDWADLVVPSGHTATLRGSGETNLDIVGNLWDGRLLTDTGSTLTLDMSGNSKVSLLSGAVGGIGNVINTGNFEWWQRHQHGQLRVVGRVHQWRVDECLPEL